jgi:uncharacterized membrane protein
MSNLVVLDFDGMHTADEVLNKLRSMQKEYLIDLEDACVVERDKNGKIHMKQAVNLTALGAAGGGSRGALWGAIVGLLFLNPLAGMAIGALTGAGAGALAGSLSDYGIRDDFIKQLGETIPKESSALFILFRNQGVQAAHSPDLPHQRRRAEAQVGARPRRLIAAVCDALYAPARRQKPPLESARAVRLAWCSIRERVWRRLCCSGPRGWAACAEGCEGFGSGLAVASVEGPAELADACAAG